LNVKRLIHQMVRPVVFGLILFWSMLLQLAQAQGGASAVPMKLIQVSPHAYYVEGVAALGSPFNRNFISNAGVIVAPDGVIVVDALGSPAFSRGVGRPHPSCDR